MSRVLLLALLVFSSLAAIGCASAPSRGWSGLVVTDNVLYVGTLQGKMVALDLAGAPQGAAPIPLWDPKTVATKPAGSGFGCASGMSTAMNIYGAPAAANGRVYIGSYSGKILWITTDGLAISDPSYSTKGPIIGSILIDADTLYVGSSDGKLYALDLNLRPKDGWPFKTGGEIWSTPVASNGVIYVTSADHNLYAIDAASGNEIWRFRTEAAVFSTPLVVNGMVYVGGCDRMFYAVPAATEDERLAAANGGAPTMREARSVFEGARNWFWTQATYYEGKIYAGCLDGRIYVFDAMDVSEAIDDFDARSPIKSPPLVVDGRLLVGVQDGTLYLLNPHHLGGSPATIDMEAPILAPLCPDPVRSLVYVHAQDGQHTVKAVDVAAQRVVWTYRTDKISG